MSDKAEEPIVGQFPDSAEKQGPSVVSDDRLGAALEAILLMATEPMPVETLAEALAYPSHVVAQSLEELSREYVSQRRGYVLREAGTGWRLATNPEFDELISAWVVGSQHQKLSQAALETLAIVAYLQPVTRSRVSSVRGVSADPVVRTLLARGLLTEVGEDPTTGAGLLRTTDLFNERLGITSIEELPAIAPLLPDATELHDEISKGPVSSREDSPTEPNSSELADAGSES